MSFTPSPTTKREINKLIRNFKAQHRRVNMYRWFNKCGTSGCIAGVVCLLHGYKPRTDDITKNRGYEYQAQIDDGTYAEDTAKYILGITDEQANRLFHNHNWPPTFTPPDPFRVKPALIAKRLKHFLKTGE